jgi:hypothetical protein
MSLSVSHTQTLHANKDVIHNLLVYSTSNRCSFKSFLLHSATQTDQVNFLYTLAVRYKLLGYGQSMQINGTTKNFYLQVN